MVENFSPSPEQLELVRRAEELAEKANATRHHASPELVRRMTEEGRWLVADECVEDEGSSEPCGRAPVADLGG